MTTKISITGISTLENSEIERLVSAALAANGWSRGNTENGWTFNVWKPEQPGRDYQELWKGYAALRETLIYVANVSAGEARRAALETLRNTDVKET